MAIAREVIYLWHHDGDVSLWMILLLLSAPSSVSHHGRRGRRLLHERHQLDEVEWQHDQIARRRGRGW